MKLFPIMCSERGADHRSWIPWEVIAPHEAQAESNHSQTLQRLAERGGLAPCEAVAVLEDRDWRRMPQQEARLRLGELVAALLVQRAQAIHELQDQLTAEREKHDEEAYNDVMAEIETLKAALTARTQAALDQVQADHYLSTACLHTRHDQCRQACKFCAARCRCACHTADAARVSRAPQEEQDAPSAE